MDAVGVSFLLLLIGGAVALAVWSTRRHREKAQQQRWAEAEQWRQGGAVRRRPRVLKNNVAWQQLQWPEDTMLDKRISDIDGIVPQVAAQNEDIESYVHGLNHLLHNGLPNPPRTQPAVLYTPLYLAGDPKGITECMELTLTEMQLRTDSPTARVAYSPQSRQLVVEYELPAVDIVPKVESYRYVKSQNKVVATARPASQVKGLYANVIAQLTLLGLARIFRVDTKQHIDVVVFNGVVGTIDPRTGNPTRPCLITLRTTRDTFNQVDLYQVDPVACLQYLKAGISRSPTELVPVRPVLELSMVDPRFITETDARGVLDDRPNLTQPTSQQFESLSLKTRPTGPPPSDLVSMSVILKCDLVASKRRQVESTEYMDRHVLGPAGFCCTSATRCRESAMARRELVDFAAGQLSHLGRFYDMEVDGVPLRILVIAMETGRTDTGITLPMRRQQVLESAAEAPRDRNPHMIGVTHALRTLHGRRIGDDSIGELLDFGDTHNRVHMFDAFAMANVRLCTSVKAGTTKSYPTAVMTRNCVRHLKETIRVLQPTVCVVQSTDIPKALAPIMTHRRSVAPHLAEVEISGVRTLMAEFSHPTAWGELNWGRWTNMPYLQGTVIPTLKEARALMGLPRASAKS
jgi:hypothetical protein